MAWVLPRALRLLKPVYRSIRLLVPLHSQFLNEHINGSMLRQEPNGGNVNDGKADEVLVKQPERLTAVVHRRAETGGAERECGVLRTAALPCFALHRLCSLVV